MKQNADFQEDISQALEHWHTSALPKIFNN